MVLFTCSVNCVLYSAGCGVKRVRVVLSGFRMILFVCVNVCIYCRYDCIFAVAICISLLWSSAYIVSSMGACGAGVSDGYMLNNVDDRTTPCGPPILNWLVDVLFPNVVYALRPLI